MFANLQSWRCPHRVLDLIELDSTTEPVAILLFAALEPFTHDIRNVLCDWTSPNPANDEKGEKAQPSIYNRLVALLTKREEV